MADPQVVWGIDVGKCALKALKLRIGPDRTAEAIAADYIEHAKIMSQQDADKKSLWAAALEKFLSRNDITNEKVVVAVPGQLTLARFSKLPPVEKKKIPDIVRYEADQQIPFDMDEVVWDYQQFQMPDSPEVEVGIFAIKRDLIRDHLLHFEAAGIEPFLVQASPLAIYNAMHFDGALAEGTVLVDIGTENTDLLVATENSLWTRTIPVGGNHFTDALVKSFKLSFGKAETLKRTAATSKYARQVFQAMRPVFSDLVQELQRSIGFFTATHRDVELSKVIGLGSAFKLPGLIKYLQQNLQLDVERPNRFQKIKIPETAEGGTDQTASYAVAYGLAVQGLGHGAVSSSLLPPEIAKQIAWRKKRLFFAAAAACLLLAAGVIWFRKMSDAGTLASNAGSEPGMVDVNLAAQIIANPPTNVPAREYGKTILAAAEAFRNERSQLQGQGDNELNKIETIKGLLENRAVWLRILSTVHGALPALPESLAAATDAASYRAAIESGGAELKRDKRPEIFIDSFKPVFLDNVDQEPIADEWGGVRDEIPNADNQPRPGFVITLDCRTPHSDKGLFVRNSYVSRLLELGRQPGQGFYVNRIGITQGQASSPGAGAGTGSGGGRRWGDRDTGQPPPSGEQGPARDPVTGEPVADDYAFQIKLDVVLADLPEKKEGS